MSGQQANGPSFNCPHCGERFRWQAMLAGRKMKCHCGHTLEVPLQIGNSQQVLEARIEPAPRPPEQPRQAAAPPPPPATPPAPPAPPASPPVSHTIPLASPAPPAAPPPVPPTVPPTPTPDEAVGNLYLEALSSKSKLKPNPDALAEEDLHTRPGFIEFHLPIILLILGGIASLVLMQTFAGSRLKGLLSWSLLLAIQALVFLPLGVMALQMTARMMDVGFGTLFSALLKLAAVTIGTGGIADGLFLAAAFQMDFDQYVLMFGFFLYLVFCGVPLAITFGIGLQETALLVGLLMVPRLAVLFGIGVGAPQLFK